MTVSKEASKDKSDDPGILLISNHTLNKDESSIGAVKVN